MEAPLDVTAAVKQRYTEAAKARETALCCPVAYNPEYLKVIPKEVIEKDYGCGDPSAYVKAGETVLDLGSGSGKICFIASQIVGREGRVIGVDMNDEMLSLARKSSSLVAEKTGFNNVDFVKGRIEDLALNQQLVNDYLSANPISNEEGLQKFQAYCEKLRVSEPLIADNSVDVVVSNCVLNLVSANAKKQLFSEIFRVLKRGGRAVISDIIADEEIPEHMRNDPTLWSGCISGAFQEKAFIKAFEGAGFYGASLDKRDEKPWQTVEGIEFRAATVVAYKGKEGECWEHNEALIFKGPFKSATDDDGHTFTRGDRIAVCRKTFEIFSKPPYKDFFYGVKPLVEVTEAAPFPCTGGVIHRHPKETKGEDYKITAACTDASCC
jgi:arsenite methyltransferase